MTAPGSVIPPQPGWWVRTENVGVNLTGQYGWAATAAGVKVTVGAAAGTYGWASSAVGSAPSTALPITFDAVGGGQASSTTAFSWSHTAIAQAYVLVAFAITGAATVSATYGGVAMTSLGSVGYNGASPNASGGVFMFGLPNAPGGAKTVAVTTSVSVNGVGDSVSYINAASANAAQTVFNTGTALSQTTTLGAGHYIVQAFGSAGSGFGAFSGGTNRYTAGIFSDVMSISDSATAATFTTTSASGPWGGIAVSLNNPNKFASVAKTITPVIAGALAKTIHSAAAQTITPAFGGALAKTIHGGAALTVTPTIAASLHLHPALIGAAKTVTPAISAAVTKLRFADAALTVTPAISAALIKIRHISAAPTITPAIAASILKTEHPAVTLAVTPAIAAVVTKTIHASATPTVTPAVAAAANLHPALIGAAKTVTPAISAALIKHRFAAAAPTITPTIAAGAVKTQNISATPTVTPAIAASATLSSGVVTFDAAGTGTSASGTSSINWSHTAASGAGIVVGVSTRNGSATITGVTYNGSAMTNLGSAAFNGITNNGTLYLFGLTTAGTGSAATIVATASANANLQGGSASYINVLSFGTAVTNTGSGSSLSSGTVSSVTNHRVHCAFSIKTRTLSAYSGTQRYNQSTGIAGGDAAGAATVSFTATGSGPDAWAAVSVDIT